jgi:SAM-dependent methyltransferase
MRSAARQLLLAIVTKGSGAQTFLGARWIRAALAAAPARRRRSLALRLLALSPHYFYPDAGGASDNGGRMALLQEESRRMRLSRTRIAEQVVAAHVRPGATVLDFGCGPGFLAVALAGHAERVIACDISDGVLACAEVINAAPNVAYVLVPAAGPLPLADESVDVVCSFAVLQHVSGAAMSAILADLHRVLRPGGVALLHVPVDKDDWESEDAWRADTSPRGRLRLRYGLNCFGRTRADMLGAVEAAGLHTTDVVGLGTHGDLHDADLEAQELFVCERREI